MTFTLAALHEFRFELLQKLLGEAAVVVRPRIPSRTLREAMTSHIDVSGRNAKGWLFIPHYWAVMVHDGTRSFGPRDARFLVYFRDEADDPRKPRPARLADARRLTKEEFGAGLQENRRLAEVNPAGGSMQHMVILRTPSGLPGRAKAKPGSFFFTEGAEPFIRRVDEIVYREFDAFVRRNLISETLKATLIVP